MSGVIFGVGLIVALALLALRLRARGPRLKTRWALLLLPFLWAAFFGVFRLLVHLTQRDLPAPSFTAPIEFYAGAASVLALTAAFMLCGRIRIVAFIVFEGTLVVAFGALNYHAVFAEDALLLRRPLSFTERRYEYRRVKSLKYVRDWRCLAWEIHRPRFVIGFDDGSRWTSDDGFRKTEPHLDIAVLQKHVMPHVMLQQVPSE